MKAKKKETQEKVIVCGLLALLITIGFIFMVVLVFEIDLLSCDKTKLVSAFSLISSGTWGVLLCRNC